MSRENTKKRKRAVILHQNDSDKKGALDTSKPTADFHPTKGRNHTLSIAVPGSIVANAHTHDLKTSIAGQIARAAAVFCVDEIVIFNDGQSAQLLDAHRQSQARRGRFQDYSYSDVGGDGTDAQHTGWSDPDHFLHHVLSYLECPPHLRKLLFPLHDNLRTAGALPSLDMPHHARSLDEPCRFREGVVLPQDSSATQSSFRQEYTANGSAAKKKRTTKSMEDTSSQNPSSHSESMTSTCYVEAGLANPLEIPVTIPPKTRVTLDLKSASSSLDDLTTTTTAEPVAPDFPRTSAGYYWGYTTRRAASLSDVFTESPFAEDGGYDLSIGTSERGVPLSDFLNSSGALPTSADVSSDAGQQSGSKFRHFLAVFGGVAGLEAAAESDPELRGKGIGKANVGEVFDAWVNLVPAQGSRTIRTEEAVWVGLMGLRGVVERLGAR